MTKLNQIIAIEKGVKNQQNQVITELHHVVQKNELLTGLARTYRAKDDEGDKLPGENKHVQVRADDVLKKVSNAWAELINISMTKDEGNTQARADVVVDGKAVLEKVPVTSLLFLEKQLVDLHTVIKKLPTLDPAEKWSRSEAQNCWSTDTKTTTSSKKVMRNHVRSPATDKHPAQVDVYTEDQVVGYWDTIKYSGAMPVVRQANLLERVEKLQRAVKFARETANSIECAKKNDGEKIFDYLLA